MADRTVRVIGGTEAGGGRLARLTRVLAPHELALSRDEAERYLRYRLDYMEDRS